jgi:anti-anti-sigma factor
MKLADLDFHVQDGILVARLEGEIDLSNVGEIRSALLREMRSDILGLVVDLTEVGYLDSTGIQVIFDVREHLNTRGHEMRLVVPEGSTISKILELVGAFSVVGIVSTEDSALAELSGEAVGTVDSAESYEDDANRGHG